MKKFGTDSGHRPFMSILPRKYPCLRARFPQRNVMSNASRESSRKCEIRPLFSISTPEHFSSHITGANRRKKCFSKPAIPSLMKDCFHPPAEYHPRKMPKLQTLRSYPKPTKTNRNRIPKSRKDRIQKVKPSKSNPPIGQKKNTKPQTSAGSNNYGDKNNKAKLPDQISKFEKSLQSDPAYAEHLKKLKRKSNPMQGKCLEMSGEADSCAPPKKCKTNIVETPKKPTDRLKIDDAKQKPKLAIADHCAEKNSRTIQEAKSPCGNKKFSRVNKRPCPKQQTKNDKTVVGAVQVTALINNKTSPNPTAASQGKSDHQNSPSVTSVNWEKVVIFDPISLTNNDHRPTKKAENKTHTGTENDKNNQLERHNSAYLEHLKKLKEVSKPRAYLPSCENNLSVDQSNFEPPNTQISPDLREATGKNENAGESNKQTENTILTVKKKVLKSPNMRNDVNSSGEKIGNAEVSNQQIKCPSNAPDKITKLKGRMVKATNTGITSVVESGEKQMKLEETMRLNVRHEQTASKINADKTIKVEEEMLEHAPIEMGLNTVIEKCQVLEPLRRKLVAKAAKISQEAKETGSEHVFSLEDDARPIPSLSTRRKQGISRPPGRSFNNNLIKCIPSSGINVEADITPPSITTNTFDNRYVKSKQDNAGSPDINEYESASAPYSAMNPYDNYPMTAAVRDNAGSLEPYTCVSDCFSAMNPYDNCPMTAAVRNNAGSLETIEYESASAPYAAMNPYDNYPMTAAVRDNAGSLEPYAYESASDCFFAMNPYDNHSMTAAVRDNAGSPETIEYESASAPYSAMNQHDNHPMITAVRNNAGSPEPFEYQSARDHFPAIINPHDDYPMITETDNIDRGCDDRYASTKERFANKVIEEEKFQTSLSVIDKSRNAIDAFTSPRHTPRARYRQLTNLCVPAKYKQLIQPSTEEVMKFKEDEYVEIDDRIEDESHDVEPINNRKPVASDFFSDVDDTEKSTTLIKGILRRPGCNHMETWHVQLPQNAITDDAYPSTRSKTRPDLQIESDVISVVPSIKRQGEDVPANSMAIDSAIASGLQFLTPVSGYHCTLCQTFFCDYPTALHHCTLMSHRLKVLKELGDKK